MNVPIDVNKIFDNELTDGDNGMCVGITIKDIIGNIIGIPCDAAFSYAAGLYMSNTVPETQGEDPAAAIAAAVVFGVLPVLQEGQPEPELLQANFANYTPAQKALALQYAQKGTQQLVNYVAIANYIHQNQKGVVMVVNWYSCFTGNLPNGILPMPLDTDVPVSVHCVAVYDSNVQGLVIKSWEGTDTGLGGYKIMPPAVFTRCFIEAYGFVDASRWLSLAYIALRYKARIWDILPQLLSTS